MSRTLLALSLLLGLVSPVAAELPAPPDRTSPWPMPWGDGTPGEMSAASVVPEPAGRNGVIAARGGHFYDGDRRVRFWGVNLAFSAALPPHDQADALADRLKRFGVNAVRLHHMDMQPFPNGLFADDRLETFSDEALDRLDYLVAALKKRGIYSDMNLHVSRWWSRAHDWKNADRLPEFDKIVDLYNPKLVEAERAYARDLLRHVNRYTHVPYAKEPAVALVEINNENTMFYWGGERRIAELPEPYAEELNKLWNRWLVGRYGSREKLERAWSEGAQPGGENLVQEPADHPDAWMLEQHESAKMSAAPKQTPDGKVLSLSVTNVDGTNWHLQYSFPGVRLKQGRYYTVEFSARATGPHPMTVTVSQAHDPWKVLGFSATADVGDATKRFRYGFTAPSDEPNARLSFLAGSAVGDVWLKDVKLFEGGRVGLEADEDPARGTVARAYPDQGFTPARLRDWYDFTQQTDQHAFTLMRDFLRDEVGVRCPITGTIALGPLGALSESKTDFVDAHAYWDHPQFPHRQWDMNDWVENNRPMVDVPNAAPVWGLVTSRVAGMPFTVTEYNHAAPNEWQAECMPIISTLAALHDWDAVFLFDYAGADGYSKMDHTLNFFDIEGNPQKMGLMPLASRLFLGGGVKPLAGERVAFAPHDRMLDTGSRYYYDVWPFVRDELHVSAEDLMRCRFGLTFDRSAARENCPPDGRLRWTASGEGTGRFTLSDSGAAVFTGFAAGPMPIDLGELRIEALRTPFASVMLVPAEPGETIAKSSRLLLCAMARGGNTGMTWDPTRHTVNQNWGSAPPQVEIVRAGLSLSGTGRRTVYALTPEGKRGARVETKVEEGRTKFEIGEEKTIWYEIVRE